jgi:nicotinamide-nucleotide amidase
VSTRKTAKRLGFLATGSEITGGEIVNSNSKEMAQQALDYGIHLGEHTVCDDACENIEASLTFMLKRHDAIIITGGLGPTRDDCTRDVVAQLAGQKLIFNEVIWNKIVERLTQRNLAIIPANNKQQAYFPEKATILPNPNGTAAGCYLTIDKTLVFLLPGPPRECIPMFQNDVLPLLLKQSFATTERLFRWRLMGISESVAADLLEALTQAHQLEFAYRAHYPFLDVKLFIDPHTKQHTKILLAVETLLRPYFVTHLNQEMSKQLQEHLAQVPLKIHLDDQATKGALLQALLTPKTAACFSHKHTKTDLEVYVSGLDDYWNNKSTSTTLALKLEIRHGKKTQHFESTVLMRGSETIAYAIEFVSWKILKFI